MSHCTSAFLIVVQHRSRNCDARRPKETERAVTTAQVGSNWPEPVQTNLSGRTRKLFSVANRGENSNVLAAPRLQYAELGPLWVAPSPITATGPAGEHA